MSSSNLHIIQKQVVDITLPDMRSAMEWEDRERDIFTGMIRNQLERCLDEFQTGDEHLVIEKLQIDLGSFTMKNLYDEMPARFYAAMTSHLQEHRQKITKYSGTFSKKEEDIFYGNDKKKDRSFTGAQARMLALHFYLVNGYLPWWGTQLAGWDQDWLAGLSTEEIGHLRDFLTAENDTPLLRIASQFSEEFTNLLLEKLGVSGNLHEPVNWLQQLISHFEKTDPANGFKTFRWTTDPSGSKIISLLNTTAMRRQYWFRWLSFSCGKQGEPALHQLMGGHEVLVFVLRSLVRNNIRYNDFVQQVPAVWKNEMEMMREEIIDASDPYTVLGNHGKAGFAGKPFAPPDAVPDKSPATREGKNKEEPGEEESIYVNEAGLVLLHPFLPQLFRNLGWMDDNNFFIVQGKDKAVYALYYLATGESRAQEYDMLLPKLLMGIPWELPLEPVEVLSDIERTTCDELLAAVINHWSVLKNTSPDGLREGFLQRSGKLTFGQVGWRLTVEPKTQDILMGRLPWGISIIKLPWMKGMLTITWQ